MSIDTNRHYIQNIISEPMSIPDASIITGIYCTPHFVKLYSNESESTVLLCYHTQIVNISFVSYCWVESKVYTALPWWWSKRSQSYLCFVDVGECNNTITKVHIQSRWLKCNIIKAYHILRRYCCENAVDALCSSHLISSHQIYHL